MVEVLKEVPAKLINALKAEVCSRVTIQYINLGEPKKIVIDKPFERMTRHLRPLYITAVTPLFV